MRIARGNRLAAGLALVAALAPFAGCGSPENAPPPT